MSPVRSKVTASGLISQLFNMVKSNKLGLHPPTKSALLLVVMLTW